MKILFNKKILILGAALLLFLPTLVSASKVYIDSARSDFRVGDSVVFNVRIDSQGKDINAVEGNVSLEYLSGATHVNNLILTDSGFSLWPRKPALSANGKSISFVGGVPQGLNSKEAILFKLILNLEKAGRITLTPDNLLVYLNDGQGTKDEVTTTPLVINVLPQNPDTQATNDWDQIVSGDKKPPEPFEILLSQEGSVFDGQKFLSFNAVDTQSGIAYYEVRENDLPPARSGNTYVLQEQEKLVKVSVTAYDAAGNVREVVYRPGQANYSAYIIVVILLALSLIFARKKIFTLVFIFLVLFSLGTNAEAAVLKTKPSQTQVSVGNIVNIQVVVDTAGKVINNAESVIQFPQDLLEVVSIEKKSSIFSLWVEEPSFSNGVGRATFNGGVPNPGFQGANGTILSITFRAKKVGVASIIFSDSAVRENDGFGTDILSSKIGSDITIASAPIPEVPQPPVVDTSFVITSSSHPNEALWYSKSNVDLSWILPKSAVAVKTLINLYPDSAPTVYYDSPLTSKSIPNVKDGVWYFHVNYLAGGAWSKTEHYKLQIDTASPTDLTIASEKDDVGKVTLHLKAEDSLSGVDRYQVVVDSDNPLTVKAEANGEASVEVPFYRSGEHDITVSVFDRAGNKAESKTTITNDYVLELRIDSYPAKIKINESIEIAGTAPYPYASLRVSLKNNNNVVETYKIKSNSYSKFNFISQPILADGSYDLWVDMLRDGDEVSLSSQKVTILAETPLLLQLSSYTIGLMKVVIPAAGLLIIFVLMIIYGWYKFLSLHRKVRKESREAEKVLEKSFDLLRKDLKKHITKFRKVESKRKLTSEEGSFLEHFEEQLSEIEAAIKKEVKDISA